MKVAEVKGHTRVIQSQLQVNLLRNVLLLLNLVKKLMTQAQYIDGVKVHTGSSWLHTNCQVSKMVSEKNQF